MSMNKGKAKVKSKSKSVAKSAGKNKAAVMNSRNPKKPMAISGDTMSNYAMYRAGGKVSKLKKYQMDNSQVFPTLESAAPNDPNFKPKGFNPRAAQLELMNKAAQKEYERRNRELQEKYLENLQGRANKDISKFIQPELDSTNTNSLYERFKEKFTTAPPRKKGGPTYKKGGVTKAKKFATLAPPYNKATAADRIAGAKKNARKK